MGEFRPKIEPQRSVSKPDAAGWQHCAPLAAAPGAQLSTFRFSGYSYLQPARPLLALAIAGDLPRLREALDAEVRAARLRCEASLFSIRKQSVEFLDRMNKINRMIF